MTFEFIMKYTQSYLDKLQDILEESDYTLRFERGTFQSGWCLLEAKKMVVLNKFLDVEGRINKLMELIYSGLDPNLVDLIRIFGA